MKNTIVLIKLFLYITSLVSSFRLGDLRREKKIRNTNDTLSGKLRRLHHRRKHSK